MVLLSWALVVRWSNSLYSLTLLEKTSNQFCFWNQPINFTRFPHTDKRVRIFREINATDGRSLSAILDTTFRSKLIPQHKCNGWLVSPIYVIGSYQLPNNLKINTSARAKANDFIWVSNFQIQVCQYFWWKQLVCVSYQLCGQTISFQPVWLLTHYTFPNKLVSNQSI